MNPSIDHPAATTRDDAGGWTVVPHPHSGFQWSAYGPRGGESGYAKTRDAATACAVDAFARLRRPVLRSA